VCDICKPSKASRYRIEVLEDPNYDHDEPLDDDTAYQDALFDDKL
jgi:hypothetical protein